MVKTPEKILKYFSALIFTDILVRGSEEDGGGFCKEKRPKNQSSYLLAPCRSTDFWEPGIWVGVLGGGCPPFLSGSSAAVKTYCCCCWHDSRSITFCRLDQCSFYSFYQFTAVRDNRQWKKRCWLLGVTGMTNLISRLWIDNVYEYYVSKCTLGNVCSMQILSTTQTSNNSNFIQFLEMLSTYVSFVRRLLFYYISRLLATAVCTILQLKWSLHFPGYFCCTISRCLLVRCHYSTGFSSSIQ